MGVIAAIFGLRRCGSLGCAGLVLAAAAQSPSPILAQNAVAPEEARRALELRRGELESTQERARSIETDLSEITEERRRLNERLVETAALIQSSEARLTAIEARLAELEAQEKLLKGSLDQRHAQVASLLGALLRMGRNPPPVVITRREDALQMVRSAMLLAAAFPELRTQALALAEKLKELVRVMTDIRTEGERLRTETARLNDARIRLAGLLESKKQSLAERRAELDKLRTAASELSKTIGDLNEFITRLDQTVSRSTGLGAYDEQLKRENPATENNANVAALDPEKSASPSDGGAAHGADNKSSIAVVEIAPSTATALNPGRIKPGIPFHLAKGRLPLPAQGRRVLAYGEKTQYGGQSKGLVLETRPGAQITSPCDGWIVYAGEFRSYGQLLIINAGGGYHVLLAGLSQIDVQLGQFVLAAEPVGTMSAATRSAQNGAQANFPVLYIEFRKDGRPIDPDPWWGIDQQKAQEDSHQKVQG